MNRFIAKIPGEFIKTYEMNCIACENPEFLIPMSFVREDDSTFITYDYSNFVKLADLDAELDVRSSLDILEAVVDSLFTCVNYLIFPDRLRLSAETVYVNLKDRSSKLLFLPDNVLHKPHEELLGLISEMLEMNITDDARDYIKRVYGLVRENTGLRELKGKIIMLRREAYLIGIK